MQHKEQLHDVGGFENLRFTVSCDVNMDTDERNIDFK